MALLHHRSPAVWRHLKAKRRHRQSDLNIRPLMNLFMVLVPFLLLYSSFVEMSVLHSAITEPGGRVSTELKPGLILEMDRQGYQLISHNCDLKKSMEKESPVAGRSMIRLTQPERPQLLAYLRRLKQVFPKENEITLRVERDRPYQEVIELMDLVREHREGDRAESLFPNIAFVEPKGSHPGAKP